MLVYIVRFVSTVLL